MRRGPGVRPPTPREVADLREYRRKRDPKATPEPFEGRDARTDRRPVFVVQRHSARRLHEPARSEKTIETCLRVSCMAGARTRAAPHVEQKRASASTGRAQRGQRASGGAEGSVSSVISGGSAVGPSYPGRRAPAIPRSGWPVATGARPAGSGSVGPAPAPGRSRPMSDLLVQRDGPVVTLVLDRPAKRNPLSLES